MNSQNVYLTILIIGIIVLSVNRFGDKKEHFGNPLSLLKKIGQGLVDFFVNFIDIMLVIADVFMALALLPFIILDIIMILITWLNPISMIKGVVSAIFTITKILFLMFFDVIVHILRLITSKIFGFLAGGLWGIPHGPEQHRTHNEIETGVADQFGDHHHHPHSVLALNDNAMEGKQHLYRPMRCYKSVGSEGWINMFATIICPPLGVFMAFGFNGFLKIVTCCILSLLYYVPGLVYALLITTHLGLGRRITAKDCGGLANYGLRIAGCTSINNEYDCKKATIPGWRDSEGNRIPACVYDSNAAGENKCYNIIYPSAIHTTGSRYRYDGEKGLGWHPGGQTDNGIIDTREEIAADMDSDGDTRNPDSTNKINYNPIGRAKALEDYGVNDDPSTLDQSDQVEIPQGPWEFVGGD